MHRSGGQWAVFAALLAGVVFAWPTYVRYLGLHPGPMFAAMAVAAVMYLPSLWAIRDIDRRQPEPPLLLLEPAQAAGVALKTLASDSPLGAALLVYSAVVNTLIMNLLRWPVLAWGLRHSGHKWPDTI